MSAIVQTSAIRDSLAMSWAACHDQYGRPELASVSIRIRDEHLVSVATNGAILARQAVPARGDADIIVPLESVADVRRTLASLPHTVDMESVAPAYIRSGEVYPDAGKIDLLFAIAEDAVGVTVERKQLLAALRQLLPARKAENVGVRIAVDTDSMRLSEPKSKHEPIWCDANATGIGHMFVNRKFLAAALQWIGGKFVTIYFGATNESKFDVPMVISRPDSNARHVAIMEMRP